MRPAAVALLALPLAALAREAPLSFLVSDEPEIRFFWGEVPDAARRNRLDTGSFSNIEPEDYVGPQTCEPCHPENYTTWTEHRHRWMNAPANGTTVQGDFGGAEIDYYGGQARFERNDERGFLMRLRRGSLERTYHVTQTIGSRFFQYYVGRQLEGPEPPTDPLYTSEHVLPFGYWLDPREWVPVVHVEKTREGEPSLIDEMRRDPYADPAVYDYARSCSQCHTTLPTGDWLIHRQPSFPPSPRGFSFDLLSYVRDNHGELLPRHRPATGLDKEEVRSILLDVTEKKAPVWETTSGISCETCHYGAREHVASGGATLPRMFPVSPRLHIEGEDLEDALARNPVNQNWTCSRCHIGERFEYAAGMGTWNSTEFSDLSKGACFIFTDERSIRCVDCHNPHVTTGRVWKNSPDEDDRLCLKCHQELEPTSQRLQHTHHPLGISGSRCMNCHMPRINEGLQDMVRTHMITSPTNRAMIESNQPNACNMCHVGETINWTVDYLHEWYGASYSETAMAESYDPAVRDAPATVGWLESWHPTTRMVAVDVLTRANARWVLPRLVDQLDSRYMLIRQFTRIGLEEMLGIRLADYDYRFYMFEEERKAPLAALRDALGIEAATTTDTVTELEREIHHFRQFVRQRPDSSNAHYHLANALVRSGAPEEAIPHYQKSVELDPEFAQAHNNLGVALRKIGQLDEALQRHRRALELDPELVDAHVALGNVLFARGQPGDAIERYRDALELAPDSADAHYNLGIALHARGELQKAVAHYQRALEERPGASEIANNLGIALQTRGKIAEAVAVFRDALAEEPEDEIASSLHNNLAWALSKTGEPDQALEHFRATLGLEPDGLSARAGIAWILATHPSPEQRRPEQAVRLAEAMVRVAGETSAELLDVLAAAYAAGGKFERAVVTAEKALSLAGDDAALGAQIRHRLELYRRREPFVAPRK